ncbi:MAG: ABC transporter substrate-binding protein [Spirochaetia bacterium]|jgi:iron(III) transport system substrate-binding protein|nr:ABC transporter substrate-binding protein [Spirochaetia bacterium]
MKKLLIFLMVAALLVTSAFATGSKEATPVAAPKPVVEELTHDELVARAKAEGKVVVYATSSRIAKAAEAFTKEYGIEVISSNLKDFELIEKVSKEAQAGVVGADFVLAQDAGRLVGELIKPGHLYNYVPPTLKGVIPASMQNPLQAFAINKVFIYNDEGLASSPYTNIWQFADPKYKSLLQFKNPFQEGVNANFLTMCTSPEWSAKIAKAYKSYFGKDIVLTTPNAGYEWIKAIYENDLIVGTSDTNIAENVGIKGQNAKRDFPPVGLFVFSKARYATSKNLALKPAMTMEPFSGFYYSLYALMTRSAANPHAAKLFIEFLYTPEGFAPWGSDVGTYSANPNNPIQDDIDFPFAVWQPLLVEEDGSYCFDNRAEVEEFLNQYIY